MCGAKSGYTTDDSITDSSSGPVEKVVLRAGLLDWGGPAAPTDALAVAKGFKDAVRLREETRALWQKIEQAGSLTAGDWRRAMLAVEIVFISDVVGSGLDWRFTSGFSDEETIEIVRRLQRKLPWWRGSWQFTRSDGHLSILDSERPHAWDESPGSLPLLPLIALTA